MSKKILVTGGAGFIGSFLVDTLIKEGNDVTIIDNLDSQVHIAGKAPDFLNKNAKFVKADMNDYAILEKEAMDAEVVFHKASAVGVAQSMYEINYYIKNNSLATANFLEFLAKEEHSIKKIIVAASMSSYGEGLYCCGDCGLVQPPLREEKQLKKKKWELVCPSCKKQLTSVATPDWKKQDANSIYALSKKGQEEMFLMIGKTYGIPAVALRYFNVFGPRQSLSNPYTGVNALFMSKLKNKKSPVIFEDGLQSRDFTSVHDVIQANILAMKSKNADFESFNVGSGKSTTIKEVAEATAKIFGSIIKPKITNVYRKGDVRHCFADISKIRAKLGFKPKISFEAGLKELVGWSKDAVALDNSENALKELKEKGIIV